MTSRQQVLDMAQSKLGLVEQPLKSNHVPGITDRFWFWNDAWCDMWVSCVLTDAGYESLFASCAASIRAYKDGSKGIWLGKPGIYDIRPADQVMYGPSGGSHTGLVAAVDIPNNRIMTYEGNWGDRSLALWRNYDDAYIFGFGRPNYTDNDVVTVNPDPGMPFDPSVHNPWTPLYVDGVRGPKTIAAMQWSLNGSQVADKDGRTPIATDGEPGPSTWSSLQRYLGFTGRQIDGEFGPISTKRLQAHLGVKADGAWGPLTTKALQRALNNETF